MGAIELNRSLHSGRSALGLLGLLSMLAFHTVRVEAQQLQRGGLAMRGTSSGNCIGASCTRLAVTLQDVPARPSGARTVGQLAGGALASAVLGYLFWVVVDNPEGSDRRVKGDAGYTPNANTAFAIGSFLGAVGAVHVIGRGDGSRSSLGRTALGAGIATVPLLLGRHEPYLPILGVLVGAPLQSIGATVGYRSGRYVPVSR